MQKWRTLIVEASVRKILIFPASLIELDKLEGQFQGRFAVHGERLLIDKLAGPRVALSYMMKYLGDEG